MGNRVIQKNYECAICGHKAEDGESMWYMGNEVWCNACCDDPEIVEKDPDIIEECRR